MRLINFVSGSSNGKLPIALVALPATASTNSVPLDPQPLIETISPLLDQRSIDNIAAGPSQPASQHNFG